MPVLDDIPTPCIIIEQHRLEANLAQMQERASAQHVALRPHTKTHKTIAIARYQQELGARGITVAKVGEAEIFVKAGFNDICLAYPIVGEDKHARLNALLPNAKLSFCVDTLEGARQASTLYARHNSTIDVLIEIDTGGKRCGLAWNDPNLPHFVRSVTRLPGLSLKGILTHEGHAYRGACHNETHSAALQRVMTETRDRMLHVATRLKDTTLLHHDQDNFVISMGSTPSMSVFENREYNGFRITEIRPGNYVFHDMTQVGLGAATLQQCALTVLSTVVSKHRDTTGRERLFLDAGSKILTSDNNTHTRGYGCILYNATTMVPLPHIQLTALSEEHGWVYIRGGSTLAIGDRVRIVPNHACVVVNTQNHTYLVDGQTVVHRWPVDTRGRVR